MTLRPLSFFLLAAFASNPALAQAPPPNLAAAQAFLQQSQFAQARASIQAELTAHPASVDAWTLLGILDTQQKSFPAAHADFAKALALNPNSSQTRNDLGNLFFAEQKPALAEKEFLAVLHAQPANPDANYAMGLLKLATAQPAAAIPYFARVHPPPPEAQLNLVRANLAARHTAEGLRLANLLSSQNPSSVQLHFSLGMTLAASAQPRLALIELQKADVLAPNTPEILAALGELWLRTGDDAKAEPALAHAIALRPDDVKSLSLLAQLDLAKNRPLDAADLLLRANKLDPNNPDILFLMAQVSINQKFFEDALPLLEQAVALAPARADIRAALGESYYKADKIQKAVATFLQLIQSAPSPRAYSFLGVAYTDLGRFDEARAQFEAALKLDPADTFSLFHLGYLAEKQGNNSTAEAIFRKVLAQDPNFPYALLELATLRMDAHSFDEAASLLRRFVQVSDNPTPGYYKLAMAERALHQKEASDRDLATFQNLSKIAIKASQPYEHLFDYLDKRSKMSASDRSKLDLDQLVQQNVAHPGQPDVLYPLAEAYLQAGKLTEARATIADLDTASAADPRTLAGTGVLLARYRLYDDAIQHFHASLAINPSSDSVNFDLANALFRKGLYTPALDAANLVSESGRDDAWLSLLGDIQVHLGNVAQAQEIFLSAIARNPDNDQDYLSLALLQLRGQDLDAARQTLLKGQQRVPASGKILWGLGLTDALAGNTTQASASFERAVELLPEWAGSYSTLGVFYYLTGQLDKAREMLDRFRSSNTGGLDIDRIQQALAQGPAITHAPDEALPPQSRLQLLQFALYLADRTQ